MKVLNPMNTAKKTLLATVTILTLTGCTEQEFYQKSFLSNLDSNEQADLGDPIGNTFDPENDIGTDTETDQEPPIANIPSDNDGGTDSDQDGDGNGTNPGEEVVDNGGGNNGGNDNETTPDEEVVDNGGGNNGGNDDETTLDEEVVDNGGGNNGGNDDETTPDEEVVDNGGGNNGGDNGTTPVEEDEEVEAPVKLISKIETFTQDISKQGKVDILWVVDDSGSMANDQQRLASNFSAFIHDFLTENVDFQMGITTTDATSRGDGKWVGNYKHLTSEAAKSNETKFINDFKRTIAVGTGGSAIEAGLHTSLRFLERYSKRIPDPFLREDAYLAIIYIADEEDQSPKSVQHYLDGITALKANASKVKIYSIVSSKTIKNSWETRGDRYMLAADTVGGVNADIKDDFYHILRNMGASIVNLTDSFALSALPYQGEVEVYVNQTRVLHGWSLDQGTRSIRFEDQATPAEGAVIEVKYSIVDLEND